MLDSCVVVGRIQPNMIIRVTPVIMWMMTGMLKQQVMNATSVCKSIEGADMVMTSTTQTVSVMPVEARNTEEVIIDED